MHVTHNEALPHGAAARSITRSVLPWCAASERIFISLDSCKKPGPACLSRAFPCQPQARRSPPSLLRPSPVLGHPDRERSPWGNMALASRARAVEGSLSRTSASVSEFRGRGGKPRQPVGEDLCTIGYVRHQGHAPSCRIAERACPNAAYQP